MDCLVKSEFTGSVAWLGRVPHAPKNIRSETTGKVDTTFEGICGETHSGLNRPSCVRVTMLYPKGTVIKNTRQISVLSAEEIIEIAAHMGLDNLNQVGLARRSWSKDSPILRIYRPVHAYK